jgi:hypothetical protein
MKKQRAAKQQEDMARKKREDEEEQERIKERDQALKNQKLRINKNDTLESGKAVQSAIMTDKQSSEYNS